MLNVKNMIAAGSALALLVIAGCAELEAAPIGDKCADSLTRCDDDNTCTFDGCDPSSGMCLYTNATNGTQCEFDGGADTCSSGVCGFSGTAEDKCADSLTRCDDDNTCTFDDCDTSSGMCLYVNATNGTQCEVDGEADTCSSGVCGLSAAASAFCQDYEETCGFGGTDRYISESDCYQTYDGASTEKQDCIEQHLGFATAEDPTTHCPHAAGQPPCDL